MVRFVPRGRPELRRLLDVGDLDHLVPSTLWHRDAEGTWRTGIEGDAQPAWQAAAHAAGSVTAWRSFTSEDGHALELQVVPLATAADAVAMLAGLADPARRVRRGGGVDANARRVEAATGAHVVIAFGSGTGWDAADLPAITAAQVAKIAS